MFISITLSAKYRCLDCRDLFREPKLKLKRKGRYYHVHDTCPSCGSKKIESREQFYSVECEAPR